MHLGRYLVEFQATAFWSRLSMWPNQLGRI